MNKPLSLKVPTYHFLWNASRKLKGVKIMVEMGITRKTVKDIEVAEKNLLRLKTEALAELRKEYPRVSERDIRATVNSVIDNAG